MCRLRIIAAALACAGVVACGFDGLGTGPETTDAATSSDPRGGAIADGGGGSGNGASSNLDLGDGRAADGAPVGPELTLQMMMPAQNVDLESEGTLGWIHWGLTDNHSTNEKSTAKGAIPTFTLTGSTDLRTYSDNFTQFKWNSGSPLASESGTNNGVYAKTGFPKFTLQRPAGIGAFRLVIYAAVFEAKGHFTVKLGTGATPPVSADLDNHAHGYGRFVIDYRAVDASNLVITWELVTAYDPNNSNVTLAAATLTTRP